MVKFFGAVDGDRMSNRKKRNNEIYTVTELLYALFFLCVCGRVLSACWGQGMLSGWDPLCCCQDTWCLSAGYGSPQPPRTFWAQLLVADASCQHSLAACCVQVMVCLSLGGKEALPLATYCLWGFWLMWFPLPSPWCCQEDSHLIWRRNESTWAILCC